MKMSSVVFVAAQYTQEIPKEQLYAALKRLIAKEPFLRVNVFYQGGQATKNPLFRALTTVDLDRVVLYEPTKTVEEVSDDILESLRLQYSTQDPLWRLYIVGGNEYMFVFDHSCFDGTSGMLFHRKLIHELNSTEEQPLKTTGGLLELSECDELPPTIESYNQTKPSWGLLARVVWNDMIRPLFGGSSDPYPLYAGPDPAVPLSSKSVFLELSAQETQSVIGFAREHKLTVNSVLLGAMAQAVARTMPEATRGSHGLLVSCPVNARRFIGEDDLVGNYVYQHEQSVTPADALRLSAPIEGGHTVEYMQSFDRSVRAAVSDPTLKIAQIVGLLGVVDIANYFKGQLKKARKAAFEVSNLGVFDSVSTTGSTSAREPVQVQKIILAQPVTALGAHYIASVATVRNGPMVICISAACDDPAKAKSQSLREELYGIITSLTA
ncbi:hypothetical protein TRVA0_044S00870 [Trichomonascus vanleenenianus]|uniref:uncharacterized protein n=1 Tax=Trichomonascus vanleenenianus TaxID=2268995 RepID=UPI003EC98870